MTLFPPNCEAVFIGEGAANVVFHATLPGGQPAFPGNLLRVPKAGTSAFSYTALQHYWESAVAPLFTTDQLVKQSLIPLAGSGIVPKLNAILAQSEPTRRKDFRGSRVADADHGMLVEDMRAQDATDVVIEFKPKWLSQSPAAPPSATRCRNCAREAYRAHKDGETQGSNGRGPLCPLQLVQARDITCGHEGDGDPTCVLCTMVERLLPATKELKLGGGLARYKPQLARWIRSNELLPRLQGLQIGREVELTMTLRDCTCFVRIPVDAGGPVEAKLGDMDRKNGEAKREYWEGMERKLVAGGYYEGREEPRQRTACWLERDDHA